MVQILVPIDVGGNYTELLKERLQKYKISHGELAREVGVSPTQLSRWFNKPIQPRLEAIAKIETAIIKIRKERSRQR